MTGEIEIEGYAAVWSVLCNRSSVIAEGAFRSLIASGTWAPQMLWHHEPGNVAGRWTAFEEDDRGLFVRGVVDLAMPYGRVAFNRVSTGEALVIENTVYNFTSLKTGLTVEVARSAGFTFRHIYDSVTKTLVTTDTTGAPIRTIFDFVGDGTQRNLSDLLVALMVRGGFDASEIVCENIDDVIDGAVVDVTQSVRDIAMSVCDPYSIAMFER